MNYLLDTNVISEMRKATQSRSALARASIMDRGVQAWAGRVSVTSLYLSAITILELEIGILLLEHRDPVQSKLLRSWMTSHVLPGFDGRILIIDTEIAQRCAALQVPDLMDDRNSLIAATALVHGMTVVTRNVADFERSGVRTLNPWE
jgi:predicted nucleic acid-binding protein